uniref:AlNc14C55G4199 protein n=1 Tax=Albugo laibachii Nc14 TaxID=890382 RepID=F0WC12_9STRA|nr:AlNc14C55G4199 [Albugo laibachii Nc14]|eukprot:CCA18693.1 AlNc14C55G4199 [Albugo laibachii Nc14]
MRLRFPKWNICATELSVTLQSDEKPKNKSSRTISYTLWEDFSMSCKVIWHELLCHYIDSLNI